MREADEFLLEVLYQRRWRSAASVAKGLTITVARVREICQSIRAADVKYSTRKKVEKIDDILLHYPHR